MALPRHLSLIHSHGERPRQHRTIPLRLVLVIPFMLLTVGTVGLVGYVCIRNGQKTVADLANQLMQETGKRVDLYLTDYLETPQLVNRLNANAVRLNQIDITNPESLKRHFVQQIQAFDSVSRIHFSNPQGGYMAIGHDERGLSVATTLNFVKGILQVHGIDQQGNRAERLVEHPSYDASQRPFYQQAIEAGKPVWAPIYVYIPASRGLGLSASYPLYNEQQQLQGVLSSDLTLVAIGQFLKNLHIAAKSTVFIIDRSGMIVASSTTEKPFFTPANSSTAERLKATHSQEPSIRLSTQQLTTQFGDLSKIETPAQLQFAIDGEQQFLQVTPFQDGYGLDWLIVVTVPESSFMGRIQANTQNAIVLSAVALTGAILLGLWLARWIARPMQQLSRASQALAVGEWQASLSADSPIAELQLLTHSFNQTTTQLQQTFEQVRTALQATEEMFATIFRTCPDPIGIVTLDGRYLEVNDAFIHLFGYAREEIIGRKASEIGQWINLNDRERYKQLVQTGERIYNQEYTLRKQSGEWITLLFSAESIDIQGQRCILSVAKEITDRKRLETSLRQQADREQLLRTITQRMRQSLDLDEILNIAVTEVRQTLKADRTLIFHLTSEGSGVVLKESVLPDYPVTQAMLWQDECFTSDCYAYYQQGEPRIVLDVATDQWADCLIEFMQTVQVKSKMVAPITQRTEDELIQVWGLLIVHACAEYRQWQSSEAELLQQIANQLAIAIQQADLYQQVQTELADRKRIETALRHSEERNRAILSAMPDLMALMSAEGIYLDIVRSNSQLDLISADINPIGKHLMEVVPAEIAVAKLQLIKRTLATGDIQTLEQQFWLNDRWQFEEVRVVPCGSDTALVMIRNITDRKQAELELIKSRDLREAIFNGSADAIFLVELPPSSRIIDCNQRAVELFEVESKAALIGINSNTLKKYPLTDADLDHIALTTQQVGCWNKEIEYITKTGRTFWGDLAIKQIQIVDQTMWLVRVTDISDQKRIEEALQQQNQALRESEERFRNAFWDAPIGMALIGLNDHWLKVNPMLCDMLGFSEAGLLSATVSSLVHPEDFTNLQQGIQQILSNENRSVQVELRYCCQQGHTVWGLMSLSLVRNAKAQPLYYVAQIQDITERQAIDRMKNEFISIVSHELRTPLTAIRGFLGLLDTGIYDNKPEKAKRMIGQALTNSDRLVRLVNDILDLERLSSGKVQLVKEAYRAEELMQRAVAEVQSIADQANVRLVVVPTTAITWADPDSIIQTLINLLSNAIKFSLPSSVVTLSATTQTDSVLFSVQDQGRGIPADKLETIFGRFQQVDVSDSRQKGGTGLGLAICHSIVQQHGGSIWAESTFGKGSTFYFTLPLPPEGDL